MVTSEEVRIHLDPEVSNLYIGPITGSLYSDFRSNTLLVHSLKQTFPWGQAASEKRADLDTQMNTDGEQRARTVGDNVFIRNVLGQLHGTQAQQQPFHIGSNGN